MRLLAAMSGGVDSSVAAWLTHDEGHEVSGVTLKQWQFTDEETLLTKGCNTLDAVADARRVADVIGIPHYTMDFREIFAREVVDPFVSDYASGLTPNPCVRCNELVRFGALLDKAEMLGFDGLVTGHYASASNGRLFRARNRDKDQSYVLYAVSSDALRRVRFPLGDIESKDRVRAIAADLGFTNADREDSLEVCFVGADRRPGDVVAERIPVAVRRGPIVDGDGNTIGEHRGLAYYTVGQRRGLGALGTKTYVTEIDADTNTIVVGGAEDLRIDSLEATRARFVAGEAPEDGTLLLAVTRYRGEETPARLYRTPEGFRLLLERPARAPAPGQAVVLYREDEVIGGGTIWRAS